MGLFEKIFGTYSKKELKSVDPIANMVLALDEKYTAMSESELRGSTKLLKERLENGESLDDILPDAFAACREAAWRVLQMKPFPVQIVGGIVLHQGRIAEMKTGEGKTLVATLPAYLNALAGKGVHIVTVNDYLARRDSEWMGKVFKYMGLTVGLAIARMQHDEKKEAYACDVTYGTNNEIGFDFLRDNMVVYKEQRVQRGFFFGIVDEVDSILIDEARTPLVISGAGEKSTELYSTVNRFVKTLKATSVVELNDKEDQDAEVDGDYIIDEKGKTVTLSKSGIKKAERGFSVDNLSDPEHVTLAHHINQAIRAHGLMKRDSNYVVKDGEVVIVDEFTGRLMIGRRYNEGLHQAIEAKENVKVARESKTLASITFQNLFRMYEKLSGMTGTALTEEGEFREIYKLDILEIPTNQPILRHDYEDAIYKTLDGKWGAVVAQVEECHKKGQPVLVGTVSIVTSELISAMLKRKGVPHEVLNAKQHDREAIIVAQAGKLGAVTIATNMAGRGTDIVLGGNIEFMAKSQMGKLGVSERLIKESTSHAETEDEDILAAREQFIDLSAKYKEQTASESNAVREAGGLFIIGTERHESRRIDNQLRGRSGRQGDMGETRFYISLEDDIMRLFGGDRIQKMMTTLKVEDDVPIEAKMLSSVIESSQAKVEGRNFGIRKNVLQYDDVMTRQRAMIYTQRCSVLEGADVHSTVLKMMEGMVQQKVEEFISISLSYEEWNIPALRHSMLGWLTSYEDLKYTDKELQVLTQEDILKTLKDKIVERYEARGKEWGVKLMGDLERMVLLKNVDRHWIDHIDAMEELRRGISLRSYAQKNPLVEYRLEGSDMYDAMIECIREDTVKMLLTLKLNAKATVKREQVAKPMAPIQTAPRQISEADKTGRNEDCPCGSGKKYKKCCGQ